MSSEHGGEMHATKAGLDDDSLMFDQSIKQEDDENPEGDFIGKSSNIDE